MRPPKDLQTSRPLSFNEHNIPSASWITQAFTSGKLWSTSLRFVVHMFPVICFNLIVCSVGIFVPFISTLQFLMQLLLFIIYYYYYLIFCGIYYLHNIFPFLSRIHSPYKEPICRSQQEFYVLCMFVRCD